MSLTAAMTASWYAKNVALVSMVATDTVVVAGHTFTCEASGAAGDQFNVGATDTLTAVAAAAAINASVTSGIVGVISAVAVGPNIQISSNASQSLTVTTTGGTSTVTVLLVTGQEGFVPVCTVTNGGASDVVLQSIQPQCTAPSGTTNTAVAVAMGQPQVVLGVTNMTVPASGALVLPPWGIVFLAPKNVIDAGPGQFFLQYSVACLLTDNTGTQTQCTPVTVTVNPNL